MTQLVQGKASQSMYPNTELITIIPWRQAQRDFMKAIKHIINASL